MCGGPLDDPSVEVCEGCWVEEQERARWEQVEREWLMEQWVRDQGGD